jgi:energy-coupling factor transporter ATP-binding protein EcfA2
MRGVAKRFGGVTLLQDVDLDAYPGEVLAIVGDNGAGKSTLIKILTGVYQPTAGAIRIGGRQVTLSSHADAIQEGVDAVYQTLALADHRLPARNRAGLRHPDRHRGRQPRPRAARPLARTPGRGRLQLRHSGRAPREGPSLRQARPLRSDGQIGPKAINPSNGAGSAEDLGFRSDMKDFGPSCFHSASTGVGNANAAPGGGA